MKNATTYDTTRRTVICDCGDDSYRRDFDDNGKPIWKCLNCRTVTPRQVRTRSMAARTRSMDRAEHRQRTAAGLSCHCPKCEQFRSETMAMFGTVAA